MAYNNKRVGITTEERALVGRIAMAERYGRPDEEITALRLEYRLAVARRKEREAAAEAERLEAELQAVSA